MLFRRIRRRPLNLSFHFRPLSLARKIIYTILLLSFFLIISTWIMLIQVRPHVILLAKSIVTDIILKDVNQAVAEVISDGSASYDKLIDLQKDSQGNIAALVTNMPVINTLQTKITQKLVDNVHNEISTKIGIPVGSAIGGLLLTDRGPKIPVRIMTITDLDTSFENDFSAAGINQTRHRIMLNISVDLDIMVPGAQTEANISTQVEIAETVIVGTVPNVYVS